MCGGVHFWLASRNTYRTKIVLAWRGACCYPIQRANCYTSFHLGTRILFSDVNTTIHCRRSPMHYTFLPACILSNSILCPSAKLTAALAASTRHLPRKVYCSTLVHFAATFRFNGLHSLSWLSCVCY